MPPEVTRLTGAAVDLSPRVYSTATVAGSPATSAETIIASVTIAADVTVGRGVLLFGYMAFTQGTDGTSYNLKLRATDASGATIKASGLIPITAAVLGHGTILGLATGPTLPNQVYVLTLTCTAASAASTVSAVSLVAIVV